MAKKNLGKEFMNIFVAFIFIQVVAVGVASMTNFSVLGLLIAGFLDVILMAVVIAKATDMI